MSEPRSPIGTEQPYPPRPYAYFTVGLIMFAYIFAFVDRVALSLVVDPIRRDLGLNDTQVGDEGMRALAIGCPALRDIYACGTKVTEACLEALQALAILENCWLKRNGIAIEAPALTLLAHRLPRASVRVA